MSTTRPGTKGWQILELLADSAPEGLRRNELAEKAECTVQRVGEVVRDNEELITRTDGNKLVIAPKTWQAHVKATEQAAAQREADKAAKAEAAKIAKAAAKAAAPKAEPKAPAAKKAPAKRVSKKAATES